MSKNAPRWLAVALAGPAVQGAILGLREGPRAMLAFALGLPVIVAAVTLLTTPTLYVGGAVFGGRLSLGQVAAGTARALHALGLALLGLAPLSLLLNSTFALAPDDRFAWPLMGLVVVGLMIALHRLAGELDEVAGVTGGRRVAWHLLFAGHTAIAFVLAARLFTDLARFCDKVAS